MMAKNLKNPVIIIAQSNIVDYEAYNSLGIERLDLYKTSVYPRMVRYKDKFISHLDYINIRKFNTTYLDSDYPQRRDLLNIWNMPSMSGIHLQNYLTVNDFSPLVINNLDSEVDWLQKWTDIYPDAPIVISTTFYLQWKEVGRIAKDVRKFTNNPIIIGGAFINSFVSDKGASKALDFLKKYDIQYAIHSFNSEPDLLNLLNSIVKNNGKNLSNVSNLIVSNSENEIISEKVWHNPLVKEIEPIWDKLSINSLRSTLQIRTASGCPFSCAFCSYPTTAKVWETSDSDNVRRHLDSITRIPNLKNIIFIDDTFNVPVERFKKLIEIFKEYDFGWFSFLRVQFVDEEIVRSMKDSNCLGVYLGIESSSDSILKNMNKQARRKDFLKGVNLLNKYDIDYVAAFVLGFPGETEETIKENIRFIEETPIKYYALKEFYYMENTSVHTKRDLYGLKGMGAKWSHNTMSYAQATDYKLRMFLTIKNSVHVDPDSSLWHLAHLNDLGFSRNEILNYQKEINYLIRNDLLNHTTSRPFSETEMRFKITA